MTLPLPLLVRAKNVPCRDGTTLAFPAVFALSNAFSLASKTRFDAKYSPPAAFHVSISIQPIVKVLLERLRTFRLPRQLVFWVALGLCGIAAAQHQLATEASTIASLDAAIAAALPTAADESSASAKRVRALIAEKRDLQIAASRIFHLWRFVYGGGVGLVITAMLAGIQVLVLQLVRPPSGSARPVD